MFQLILIAVLMMFVTAILFSGVNSIVKGSFKLENLKVVPGSGYKKKIIQRIIIMVLVVSIVITLYILG